MLSGFSFHSFIDSSWFSKSVETIFLINSFCSVCRELSYSRNTQKKLPFCMCRYFRDIVRLEACQGPPDMLQYWLEFTRTWQKDLSSQTWATFFSQSWLTWLHLGVIHQCKDQRLSPLFAEQSNPTEIKYKIFTHWVFIAQKQRAFCIIPSRKASLKKTTAIWGTRVASSSFHLTGVFFYAPECKT